MLFSVPKVDTDILFTLSETVMKHKGLCTSAWRVCSGNLNISGIYGAESRYGGAGDSSESWHTPSPAPPAIIHLHTCTCMCHLSARFALFQMPPKVTKQYVKVEPLFILNTFPTHTSDGKVKFICIESLVFLIQDAHLCMSSAHPVQSDALQHFAADPQSLNCVQTGCRWKLMLPVSLLCGIQ